MANELKQALAPLQAAGKFTKEGPLRPRLEAAVAAIGGPTPATQALGDDRAALVALRKQIGKFKTSKPAGYKKQDMNKAAESGDVAKVNELLDAGIDPNAGTEKTLGGYTPLHNICRNGTGDMACVKALLAGGADHKAKDQDGETVVYWAKKKGHDQIKALIELMKDAAPPKASAAESGQGQHITNSNLADMNLGAM